MESSIEQYAEPTQGRVAVRVSGEHEVPAHLRLDELRRAGHLSVADEEYRRALDAYMPLRGRLVSLCRESGWPDDPDPDSDGKVGSVPVASRQLPF